MSAVDPASMRPYRDNFRDEPIYNPMLDGELSEEAQAHLYASKSVTPNPQANGGFSPPVQKETMGDVDESPVGNLARDDSELFGFARFDSGLLREAIEGFATTKEPGDGIVADDVAAEPPSRKSSGLAAVSTDSRLLSPTLTTPTLSPTAEEFVPPMPYKQLGGGDAMARYDSLSTDHASDVTTQAHLQHTPMSNALSSHSHADQDTPGASNLTSPIVRVSRPYSPARPHIETAPSFGKRNYDDTNYLAPEYPLEPEIDLDQEPDASRGRAGLSPSARSGLDEIPSINEADVTRGLDKKNERVESWAMKNANLDMQYLDPNNMPGGVAALIGRRSRAKSTSKDSRALRHDAMKSGRTRREAQERSTPGPNVLIDEDSGEEEEDDDEDDARSSQESAPASVDGKLISVEEMASPFGRLNPEGGTLDAFPWVDPIYLPSRPDEQAQPESSNAAIARFLTRNRDIETASRAATWGTRRMSDSTLDQVLGDKGLFSRLKLTSSKEKAEVAGEETRSSLQEGVAQLKQVYRSFRSNSVNRRKSSDPMGPLKRTDTYVRGVSPHSQRPAHDRKESSASLEKVFSRSPSQRKSVLSRPQTPRLDTGALAAITTAGLGLPGFSPTGPGSPTHSFKEGFKRLREGLSLHRHHSEDSHGSSSIADMMQTSGGPPVPSMGNLTPPAADNEDAHSENRTVKAQDDNDDDDARTTMDDTDKGVKMAMAPQKDLIIPNFDGFKTNVRDVNPRLEEWLVERLGQEQLRRYKRLVECKVQHMVNVEKGICQSGKFCAAGENFKHYFQLPKSARKDSSSSDNAEIAMEDLDEDEQAIAEGAVSEAQFPPGLPMPPVERLPAQFECPYCFQVKKFTKPSDWSKHVHEDLQPFTCTFKHCSDPKSFKRKADWVRHENERHRQLEWWECSEEGCQHRCYRRDNFVQHLIREHKLPEPPNRPTKQPNRPAVRGPAKTKGRGRGNTNKMHDVPPEEKVLLMVETCRHETQKSANQEKCRFCDNVCNSWKKLTVHLARHMEQLSIPVLELVKVREVNVNTIISPLDPRPPMSLTPSPVDQPAGMDVSFNPSEDLYQTSGQPVISFTAPQMNPGAFTPSYPMNQPMVHGPGHQFVDHAAGMYQQAWTNQQAAAAIQYATGAPAYGNQPAHYSPPMTNGAHGQPAFGADVYMNDPNVFSGVNAPMGPWNAAGNPQQHAQYANMANAASMRAFQAQGAQGARGAGHAQQQQRQQQHQQHQQFYPDWQQGQF